MRESYSRSTVRAGNGLGLEVLYERRTGIKTERICRLAEMVEKYSGVPIPVHKPVVGTSSFAHEAGIYVAAVLRNPQTYEAFPHEKVGRTRRFSLGKHSGSALVGRQLRKAGVQLTRKQVREITDHLKGLKAGRSKRRLRELMNAKRGFRQGKSRGFGT